MNQQWNIIRKRKRIFEKPKIDVDGPWCKQRSWVEFDKACYCENCLNNIIKQKHQINRECTQKRSKNSGKTALWLWKNKRINFSYGEYKNKTNNIDFENTKYTEKNKNGTPSRLWQFLRWNELS